MTELAMSYAECYGIDRELTWKTAMLHDIAKEMSKDEMIAVAEKYGHSVSKFSLDYPVFMHAEVGALIAEREFGLKDKDALNAIWKSSMPMARRPGRGLTIWLNMRG